MVLSSGPTFKHLSAQDMVSKITYYNVGQFGK